MTLRTEDAKFIISSALAEGEVEDFAPLAVAVLDAGGHLIAFERQDGSANMRYAIAFGKANGALALGVGSRQLMRRAESQPYFLSAASDAIGGSMIPVPGGVLIRDGDHIIGAVGVSGDSSDNDERCAIAGIRAAGFEADPG